MPRRNGNATPIEPATPLVRVGRGRCGCWACRPSTTPAGRPVTLARTANEARVLTPDLALRTSTREGDYGQRTG